MIEILLAIIGVIAGYAICWFRYQIAIERWSFDCSPTRAEDWEKETHNHG